MKATENVKISKNVHTNSKNDDFTSVINKCNTLLMNKAFEECLECCQSAVDEARNLQERQGCSAALESLCVLLIQVLAELNRWQEVLPYITRVYNGIEDCPQRIVQLCVLLHAHMKDYTTCNAVAHIWLRNPQNFKDPHYKTLVSIFLTKVLIPQERWSDVPLFLEGCPALSQEHQESYAKYAEDVHRQLEEERLQSAEKQKEKDGTDQDSVVSHKGHGFLYSFIHQVSTWISKNVPLMSLSVIKNMAILAVILYLLITRANIDFISNSRMAEILASIGSLWKAMFAPFHMARK